MLSLCLHLSSLSLYLLITTVIVINYGLEYVTNVVIAYISFSAHILFDYKFVLVSVRTYVIHLLGTYVIILCNWLIL